MDRNYIVELIKANRLQEALKAIEKASEGSHLHNQAIMLSSSYAEYAQLNRTATQDFQTLEMQRAKITNSLLSFLDELAPEDFDKITASQARTTHTHTAPTTDGIDKKKYWYGAGGLVLVLLLIFFLTRPHDEPATNADVLNGLTASYVSYNGGHYQKDGSSWIEELDNGEKFRLKEVSTEECCVELRDDVRGMNVHLDLTLKQINSTDDEGKKFQDLIQDIK